MVLIIDTFRKFLCNVKTDLKLKRNKHPSFIYSMQSKCQMDNYNTNVSIKLYFQRNRKEFKKFRIKLHVKQIDVIHNFEAMIVIQNHKAPLVIEMLDVTF